ncbi:hypothetical protein XM53_10790 [Roseovarius atlanticus]|uniref:Peptidase M48 domain-containing protein n=1 Tax=Roseovarius atlanticus TaxID=1641875 RepID=A0A0T5NUF2_9RHOB|nr:M48 family metallopeptidase [Roseovarius atlanticus]KRS12568.1 hypothetical protein XM53_10790 [Roseovarius atlanticus]
MIDRLIDRWQERHADALLAQARREVDHSKPRITPRLAVGWVLSVVFLATPFIVMGAGVVLIAVTFPRVLPILVGLILIGFGVTLLPPKARNTDQTLRRADLPALFALLDRIAERLGTTPPDGVHVNIAFNAYMGQFPITRWGRRQEWILGLGLPLWMALTPQERIGLLAHEMAHKVNDDPMRQGVFLRAISVLENWRDTFELEQEGLFGGATLVQGVAAVIIETFERLLRGMSFFESQRAEYRADAAAARTAGAASEISSLEKIMCAILAERSIIDLYPYKEDRGGRIFDHMGAAVSDAPTDLKVRLMADAAREKRRVDNSHPPTALRAEFVASLSPFDDAPLDAEDVDFAAIDAELQPIKDALGARLMEDLYEFEVNR